MDSYSNIRSLSVLILVLSISTSISAQVIGDDALRRAQSGDVTFMEGQFIAYLSDTVSPQYAELQLNNAGFEILFMDITPVEFTVINLPDEETIQNLKAHPMITELIQFFPEIDTAAIEQEILSLGLPMSQRESAIQRMIEVERYPVYMITFDYSVDESHAREIMREFRNVAYEVSKNYPRTVNIAAEPGTESDVMAEIEKLPFVESTALIAVLND